MGGGECGGEGGGRGYGGGDHAVEEHLRPAQASACAHKKQDIKFRVVWSAQVEQRTCTSPVETRLAKK